MAATRQTRGERDVARGVAVRAEVRDEPVELVEREGPGSTPFADDRDDRVVATEARHIPGAWTKLKEGCGAPLEVGGGIEGSLTDAALPAMGADRVREDLDLPHFRDL